MENIHNHNFIEIWWIKIKDQQDTLTIIFTIVLLLAAIWFISFVINLICCLGSWCCCFRGRDYGYENNKRWNILEEQVVDPKKLNQ